MQARYLVAFGLLGTIAALTMREARGRDLDARGEKGRIAYQSLFDCISLPIVEVF